MQSAIWVTAAYWSVFKPRYRKENGTFRFEPSSCAHPISGFFQGTFVVLMLLHPDWILGRSPLVRMLAWRPTPDYVVFFCLLANGALSDMAYAVF